MTTDVAVRKSFDLTRAPDEQWNEEMVKLVASQVLRGKDVTRGELYYCLSIAEGLNLNPFIGEVYFIPSKSRDAQGPRLTPYVGRNGLVKKATERGAYFESDTVHENDKFRMQRRRDGEVVVTHSYGAQDRGAIVGAYAFLHFRNGDRPVFFFAPLEDYLPSFDADWKMKASPWGNQRSAMIEKCAMIGAARKRLDLGNVLSDGEIESVQTQSQLAPPAPEPEEFDWEQLPEGPRERLRAAVERVNELAPLSWPAAKLEMVLAGRSDEDLDTVAEQIEAEADLVAQRGHEDAVDASSAPAGERSPEPAEPGEGLTEAPADALRLRLKLLEEQIEAAGDDEDMLGELSAEHDIVSRELAALEDPGQGQLGV